MITVKQLPHSVYQVLKSIKCFVRSSEYFKRQHVQTTPPFPPGLASEIREGRGKHVLWIKASVKSDSSASLLFLANACFLVELPLHKDQMEHLVLEN